MRWIKTKFDGPSRSLAWEMNLWETATKRNRRVLGLEKVVEALGGSWARRMEKGLRMTMVQRELILGTELPGKKKG